MFDEILDYLLNEDTNGYPNPENLEYSGYTLEAIIDDMLHKCLRNSPDFDITLIILDLLQDLELGTASWNKMIEKMENAE